MAKIKYLETALKNQNCTHEGIKSTLNMWNACYHSVQDLLSYHPLSKKYELKYRNLWLCFLFYMGVKLGSLYQIKHRLTMFENRMQKRICRTKGQKLTGVWRTLSIGASWSALLANYYLSIDMRKVQWMVHLAFIINAYSILVGKPYGNKKDSAHLS